MCPCTVYSVHVQGRRDWGGGGGSLHGEAQCIMGNGHIRSAFPQFHQLVVSVLTTGNQTLNEVHNNLCCIWIIKIRLIKSVSLVNTSTNTANTLYFNKRNISILPSCTAVDQFLVKSLHSFLSYIMIMAI